MLFWNNELRNRFLIFNVTVAIVDLVHMPNDQSEIKSVLSALLHPLKEQLLIMLILWNFSF